MIKAVYRALDYGNNVGAISVSGKSTMRERFVIQIKRKIYDDMCILVIIRCEYRWVITVYGRVREFTVTECMVICVDSAR